MGVGRTEVCMEEIIVFPCGRNHLNSTAISCLHRYLCPYRER